MIPTLLYHQHVLTFASYRFAEPEPVCRAILSNPGFAQQGQGVKY